MPALPSGEETDISLHLTAPNSTGRHVAYFKLQTPEGAYFGQRLWADVRIAEDENANSWHVISASNNNSIAEAFAPSSLPAAAAEASDAIPAVAAVSVVASAPVVVADESAFPGDEEPRVSAALEEAHAEWATVWEKELSVLRDMGFTDVAVLLPLLQEHCSQPVSMSPELNGIPPAAGMQDVLAVLLSRSGRQF